MTAITENARWEEAIYELRIMDPVLGGAEGISNRQAAQLANRTQWLKTQSDKHDEQLDAHAELLTDYGSLIEAQTEALGLHHGILVAHGSAADPHPQYAGQYRSVADGTADALLAMLTAPLPEPPRDQTLLMLRAQAANESSTPTLSTDSSATRTIVKEMNQPLNAGDIGGEGHDLLLYYSALYDNWVLLNPARQSGLPVGSISYWPMVAPPEDWLVRDGAELSRMAYAELFAVLGTTYGAGDGISTFNLPDDRGNFLRGWDNGRGKDSGRGFGTEQEDAIRNINGELTNTGSANNNHTTRLLSTGTYYSPKLTAPFKLGSTATGRTFTFTGNNYKTYGLAFDASLAVPTAAENRPRNRAYLPIIKYR